MKLFLARLSRSLRQVFDFHQPQFLHLECIDIVLENKLLLLVSWDVVHANKIKIRPGKFEYYSSTSAAVCRLPDNTNSVDIITANLWRSNRITFQLKRLAVDQHTWHYVDGLLLKKLNFAVSQPKITLPSISLKHPQLNILMTVKLPAIDLSINYTQLNDYAP